MSKIVQHIDGLNPADYCGPRDVTIACAWNVMLMNINAAHCTSRSGARYSNAAGSAVTTLCRLVRLAFQQWLGLYLCKRFNHLQEKVFLLMVVRLIMSLATNSQICGKCGTGGLMHHMFLKVQLQRQRTT